jgi:Na+-driven multidrug efflux pump
LSHHLDKISSNISKIATAIFFVNFFAYGRVFFATILATRISHGAVVALSFSMSVMTVITMVIFGILSIVGQDIAQAKEEASYQSADSTPNPPPWVTINPGTYAHSRHCQRPQD